MKEVVFFDLDNTIIDGFTHDFFAKYLLKKRLINPAIFILLGFFLVMYKIGIIKNPKKLYEFGLSYTKGYSSIEAKKIVKDFYDNELSTRIFPKIAQIIDEHLKNGNRVVVISNQGDILVKDILNSLKITDSICTKIGIDQDNKFTGKIDGEIVYSSRKKQVAEEFLRKNNLVGVYTWGYADHDSDIELLSFVNKPIAVNPNTKLRKFAAKNNWQILERKDLY